MAIDTGSSFILGQGYVLAKMNRKTISMIDGDDLAAETLVSGKIYVLMGDGGGFLKNDVIYRDADNLAWRFLTMEKHTHFGDSNNQGGNFNDILMANLGAISWDMVKFPRITDFQTTEVSGTAASATFDATYQAVQFYSGTAANGLANGKRGGNPFSYTKKSKFIEKMRHVGPTTSFFSRSGIDMESVNTTNNNNRKYGKESCEATNGNWFIVSSDGTSRTQSDSTRAIQNDVEAQVIMTNNPGSSIDFQYEGNAINSKTTNLPNASTTTNQPFSAGVKSTNTTSKKYVIHGMAFIMGHDNNRW